jgi:hypothetical protein
MSRVDAAPLLSLATDPAWDEAFLRVESYLRAHHFESRVWLNQLATRLITEAKTVAESRPDEEIVTLAMRVAQDRIGAWFARVFGAGEGADERLRARGRLALVLTGLPERWPQYFLSDDPLPEELTTAMRHCAFQPGPELRFTNMPPSAIEFAFGESADPDRPSASRAPFLRAAASWLVLVGLIGLAWVASH